MTFQISSGIPFMGNYLRAALLAEPDTQELVIGDQLMSGHATSTLVGSNMQLEATVNFTLGPSFALSSRQLSLTSTDPLSRERGLLVRYGDGMFADLQGGLTGTTASYAEGTDSAFLTLLQGPSGPATLSGSISLDLPDAPFPQPVPGLIGDNALALSPLEDTDHFVFSFQGGETPPWSDVANMTTFSYELIQGGVPVAGGSGGLPTEGFKMLLDTGDNVLAADELLQLATPGSIGFARLTGVPSLESLILGQLPATGTLFPIA